MDWQPQSGGRKYHLLLASDIDFTRVLVDKVMTNDEFVHGNLREGEYYWKVSSINSAGEGAFSPVRRFTLKQDQLPPALVVSFPPEAVQEPEIEISGKSEADAAVYISGEMVAAGPDGSFTHILKVEPGINIVVVEAIDRAGNVSYQSRLINGKY